jgi:hypothetical protein
VKSNLKTAIPRPRSARLMRDAAAMSFEHVKQWAKSAQPAGVPAGSSSRAASFCPAAFGNRIAMVLSLTTGFSAIPNVRFLASFTAHFARGFARRNVDLLSAQRYGYFVPVSRANGLSDIAKKDHAHLVSKGLLAQ